MVSTLLNDYRISMDQAQVSHTNTPMALPDNAFTEYWLEQYQHHPSQLPAPAPATKHRKLRSYYSCISFQLSLILLLSSLQLAFTPVTAQQQQQQQETEDTSTPEWKGANNPLNQFCGITYDEARQFCHLEPQKSLPCPNGADADCPYNMPCWEITESCTTSPTYEPTLKPTAPPAEPPTASPITKRSKDPKDHNFCGLGFDNLFGCAMKCPNGSPAECPTGQLCYFDTVCDARIEGILLGEPTRKPTAEPTQIPTISARPTKYIDKGLPDGRSNFCGESYQDASENCSRDRHCPMGSNDECPGEDMFCFANLSDCNVRDFPTAKPTISPKPTFKPSFPPTTLNPATTLAPSPAPLDADDIRNLFFCGTSWGDASSRCYRRCLSGSHDECPGDEECFAQAGCKGIKDDQPAPAPDEPDGPDVTLSPDATPYPSPMPAATDEPTNSPLEADDYRNFFYCGVSWMDASTRCHKRCVTSLHTECPDEEECFAQADCKNGVQVPMTTKPTISPTPMPFDGTLSPTSSPVPTNGPTDPQPTVSPTNPQPTVSPVNSPTLSPDLNPTESPSTPFPTNHPTYAPCAGEPCSNKEYCRSSQNFCGPGEAYCNDKSIWTASCGVPTDPPASASPTTTDWPSSSPSMSNIPTITPPTETPIDLSDMIYYLNTDPPTASSPTEPNSPSSNMINSVVERTKSPSAGNDDEEEDVNDQEYGPDDPAGSFFCGNDWNNAISDCPFRCPSGEADECPNKMSCYAFTPCIGIGMNSPPTKKPTWEPTKTPTLKPTHQPTTTVQYWSEQNAQLMPTGDDGSMNKPTPKPVWWTPEPTPRPTYSPTEDQCRGLPCDYQGECRSRLGFCGEGIVYCNSASSWVPDCGGGGALIQIEELEEETSSPNTVPTEAPISSWEAWVENNNNVGNKTIASDANQTGSDAEDTGIADVSSAENEEEGDSSSNSGGDYNLGAWENWGSEGRNNDNGNEDSRWWIRDNGSYTTRMRSLFAAAISWTLFFWQMAFSFR